MSSSDPQTVLRALARLVASHQQAPLLEAVVGSASDAELERRADRVRYRTPGTVEPAELLLQEAARILPRAATFLRQSAASSRERLGGCTIALVSLAAQQALETRDALQRRESSREERRRGPVRASTASTDAVEHTRSRLRRARRQGAQRTIEIQRLFAKIDPDTTTAAVDRDERDAERVAQALDGCAEQGAALLRRRDEALLARAMLFGLDGGKVQSWRHEARAIRDTAAELEALLAPTVEPAMEGEEALDLPGEPLDDPESDLVHALGRASILLSHVVEAFEAGHRLDRTIPKLHSMLHAPERSNRRPRARP